MSGFLFLLVIDWIMRATVEGSNGWKLCSKLEDLDFGDDIALISSTREQIQRKGRSLSTNSKGIGLKIDAEKTKLLRLNTSNTEKVQVDDQDIEEVESRNVISVLLYGCKTWRTTQADEKKLDAFLRKGLRRILKIYWPMRITNEEVRRRAGIRETISDQVARWRWTWLCHVLRMDHHSHPRIALTWVPEGKRKRGRPRETWRRTVEGEIKDRGLRSWSEAATAAKDRTTWKERACSPIPHPAWENMEIDDEGTPQEVTLCSMRLQYLGFQNWSATWAHSTIRY